MTREEILDFYRQPGPMTSAGEHTEVFDSLPTRVEDLAAVIQGVMLHEHWAPAYGQELTSERRDQSHIRSTATMLHHVLANDVQPLTYSRPLESRIIGTCRNYSVMMVAFLRARSIPARARCGFGAYFNKGNFEDHWVCEQWDSAETRWKLVDAQIDEFQRSRLALDFDLLDVPRDQFLVAGDAWSQCRAGLLDPDRFGIADMRGLWFVGGNVIRDLASLNNMEMLPWDDWAAMPDPDGPITDKQLALYDRVAEVTHEPDAHFQTLRALYADERVSVPATVHNAVRNAMETV